MAVHTLLCVEPDEATLATIRGALEPYGFKVTNITNGEDAVAWGRQNTPDLVIVSVEPRKVGYAICNKFKRSPELKDIPLILSSGDETPDQLEQHRKLKVRANEYLVKPFSQKELLDKIREVFPLGAGDSPFATSELRAAEAQGDDEGILLSSDVLEELSIGDSDIVDVDSDNLDVAEVTIDATGFNDESTQAISPQALNIFDHETDAAFAAIQQPDALPFSVGSGKHQAPWDVDPDAWDAEATSSADIREEEVEDALAKLTEPEATRALSLGDDLFSSTQVPTRAVGAEELERRAELEFGESDNEDRTPLPPPPPPPPSHRAAASFDDDEPEIETFAPEDDFGEAPKSADGEKTPAFLSVQAGLTPPPSESNSQQQDALRLQVAGLLAETAALRAEQNDLQQRLTDEVEEKAVLVRELAEAAAASAKSATERDELSRAMDELKSRPQSAASARDREILNLREVINKKERDLLDIRDQLDAKERLILDHKDRIRENERTRRDLEDKSLGLEKALMDANERVEATTSDKQKGADRERILKSRLDDAHIEIQKAHDEVESLKKRGQATEDRLRGEMDRLRGELEARILDSEEAHRSELANAAEERSKFEATAEQEHRDEVARLRATQAAELENTVKKAAEELATLDDRLQSEMLRVRKDNDKATASLKEEHALQLAAEREAHQTALEAKEKDHRNEILGMRRRHEDELRASDERRQKELEEQDLRFKVESDASENRRRAELQARDEQHSSQVADMDRRHFEEKTKTAERHRGDMDDAHARAARAEGDLAARTEELSEAHRRIAGLEADLDSTRADLRDREVKLSQANLRMAELEAKTTGYEEQIMRSYQRLRSDDKVIEKAKRALAVALSLLEERGMAPVPTPTPPVDDAQNRELPSEQADAGPLELSSPDGGAS